MASHLLRATRGVGSRCVHSSSKNASQPKILIPKASFKEPLPKIGFVGTGVMGAAISQRLINDGYHLTIYNRSRSDRFEELVDLGAVAAANPGEVGAQSDIVFTMVGGPPDVSHVVAGPDGILSGLKAGGMTVDLTTSCPELARDLHKIANDHGVVSIDAPVTGGDAGAKNGTMSMFLGGPERDCLVLEEVLTSMATTVTRFGEAGAGQSAKLANQIGISGQILAMAESMVFAHSQGIDLAKWLPAIATGGAGSFSMNAYAPRVMRRDFDPGFFVEHFIKDMDLALHQCRVAGLSLPGLALCQSLFLSLKAQGNGHLGIQALVLAIEGLNAVTLPTAEVIMPGSLLPSTVTPTETKTESPPKLSQLKTTDEDFRVINLSAGPACIDVDVLKEAQTNFVNHKGSGMGMMEMSHRDAGGVVQTAIQNATDSVRDLLEVPENYHVLWMQGGAHGQFAASLMNCLGDKKQVDVVETGFWSERFRTTEAERVCDVNVAWSGASNGYKSLASPSEWNYSTDSAFLHMCMNETIQGTEFFEDPTLAADAPFISCDATSTLMSRPVDINKYGIIYASGGKNLGTAGTTCVIVRDDLLGNAVDHCPSVLNYTKQAFSAPISSIYNTPPTYLLYMAGLVLDKYKQQGGLEHMESMNKQKAGMVYDLIDNSNGFYTNTVSTEDRSRMNAPFRILDGQHPELESALMLAAKDRGIEQLFAHPLYPGLRITMYNGLEQQALETTAQFMKDFYHQHRVELQPSIPSFGSDSDFPSEAI